MSNLNLLLFLNASSDSSPSNSPSMQNFKWARNLNNSSVSKPVSLSFSLAPGESKLLFDGTRTLLQDGTTQYDLELKPLTTSTYILTWTGGTAPAFRTARSIGSDATTAVSVTVNGPLATFTSVAGTAFNFATVSVGDSVRIGNLFNVANQGEWKIISKTVTSITVENELASAEASVLLGAGFADQVKVYSAAGVQIGDTLKISGGFSPASYGSYKVTSVASDFIEFSSLEVLPQESAIQTQLIAIYSSAKQLVYLESSKKVGMTINGVSGNEIEPFIVSNSSQPGMFLRKSTIYSMTVTNDGTETADLFFAAVE